MPQIISLSGLVVTFPTGAQMARVRTHRALFNECVMCNAFATPSEQPPPIPPFGGVDAESNIIAGKRNLVVRNSNRPSSKSNPHTKKSVGMLRMCGKSVGNVGKVGKAWEICGYVGKVF